MNILIDGSSYGLDNVGDAAMLQVATSRLLNIWPRARISVYTKNPGRLALLNPSVLPLSPYGRHAATEPTYLTEWSHNYLPQRASKYLTGKEQELRRREHPLLPLLTRCKMTLDPKESVGDLRHFIEATTTADLVLASGGGYLNDAIGHGKRVLATVASAIKLKIPTAMVGQGLGPVADQTLFAELEKVLPKAGLIALREKKYGSALLAKMGVDPKKVFITGDDAIELAHSMRPDSPGQALGINIRVAAYAGVTERAIDSIREVVTNFCDREGCDLLAVPIDLQGDIETIGKTFDDVNGLDEKLNGHASVETAIRQAGRCRVIVTGSYHAAVFGAAQGIPTIGLVNSGYYKNKFGGLADMFRTGTASIDLRDAGSKQELAQMLNHYWNNADVFRPSLIAKSQEQIEAGIEAYLQLKNL